MSLRVAQVISGLGTGGAEIILARLLASLDRDQISTPVVSLGASGVVGRGIVAAGTEVQSLDLRSIPGPAGMMRLRRTLKEMRPDVIQSWLVRGNVVTSLAASGLAPISWGIHMSDIGVATHGRGTVALQRLERGLSNRSPSAIVACSTSANDEILDLGYPAGRVSLIPNGVDLDEFHPDLSERLVVREELGITGDAPVIGHFARYHPMKDHSNLLEAASLVLRRLPEAVFVLCGDGVEESTSGLVERSRPLGNSVRLLGSRDDVARLMRALDLAVLSSASGEAMPLVIGEAMASGVPFVATDVGDSAAMIGDVGAAVPPRDPKALAAAMLAVLELPGAERFRLAQEARARVASEFALSEMSRRYVELWRQLASRTA